MDLNKIYQEISAVPVSGEVARTQADLAFFNAVKDENITAYDWQALDENCWKRLLALRKNNQEVKDYFQTRIFSFRPDALEKVRTGRKTQSCRLHRGPSAPGEPPIKAGSLILCAEDRSLVLEILDARIQHQMEFTPEDQLAQGFENGKDFTEALKASYGLTIYRADSLFFVYDFRFAKPEK